MRFKKIYQLKTYNSIISRENREFSPIFAKIIAYIPKKKKKKKCSFKNYQLSEKIIFSELLMKIAKFLHIYA